MRFVGWVPTITGRLSFSRIGASGGSHRAYICNRLGSDGGFAYGSEKRLSRDGPLPDFIMGMFGRISATHFFVELEVEPCSLPDSSGAPAALPAWRMDTRGKISGTVIMVVGGFLDAPNVHKCSGAARKKARYGDSPAASDLIKLKSEVRADIASLWSNLLTTFHNTPGNSVAFTRASVNIDRTGRCDISVEPADLYSTNGVRELQQARANAQINDVDFTASNEVHTASSIAARQIFFFLRDLTHRHYHHRPHYDLATTVYEADPDDQVWRRETHYGLMRMAIAQRRENDARTYKQSLGITAYAEAFQNALAAWRLTGPAAAIPRSDFYKYDFGTLRTSMEASLRQEEHDKDSSHSNLLFFVGGVLTLLGVILASGQIYPSAITGSDKHSLNYNPFWWSVKAAVNHPLVVLGGASFLILLFLIGAGRLFGKSWSSIALRSGLARFVDACLGSFSNAGRANAAPRDPLVAWIAASGALLIVIGVLFFFLSVALNLLVNILLPPFGV